MIKQRIEQNVRMYKLILIDFYMPEMNGDECIKRIMDIFNDV